MQPARIPDLGSSPSTSHNTPPLIGLDGKEQRHGSHRLLATSKSQPLREELRETMISSMKYNLGSTDFQTDFEDLGPVQESKSPKYAGPWCGFKARNVRLFRALP
jgi:hypothetical protein